MDNQETREVTTTYADGSTVTMTIDRKTGALLDYNATPPPPRDMGAGLPDLAKHVKALESAVAQYDAKVSALEQKVSQIGTLKTEINKFDDILDHRLDALREDIKNTYLYQIFEVGRSADKIGERVSTLESQLESITARLDALEQK